MGRQKGVLLPEEWFSGPDPVDHRLYIDCQRARAQAWYRGQDWTITEQQYIDIWRTNDWYKLKGRGLGSVCLSRIDPEKGWHIDNVEIVERFKHYSKAGKKSRELANVQYRL